MGLSVVLHSWCFGLSSVDSHAGEVRMSYDPRFVTARDFMAASLPLNSSGLGWLPGTETQPHIRGSCQHDSHVFAS